jgi:hypothetical protein
MVEDAVGITAQHADVCELEVCVRNTPGRRTPMGWLLDALESELSARSQFFDCVEQVGDDVFIYLHGRDPGVLVQVTREVLHEFGVPPGTYGVLTIPTPRRPGRDAAR